MLPDQVDTGTDLPGGVAQRLRDSVQRRLDDLAGSTGPLTESRAEAVIQTVPRHVPAGGWIAWNADIRYGCRIGEVPGENHSRI